MLRHLPLYADVAPTLVAKQPGVVVIPERRLLTGREALWLQGMFEPPPLPNLSDAVVRRLSCNRSDLHLRALIGLQWCQCTTDRQEIK